MIALQRTLDDDSRECEMCLRLLVFCKDELKLDAQQAAWWLFTAGIALAVYNCNGEQGELDSTFAELSQELVERRRAERC